MVKKYNNNYCGDYSFCYLYKIFSSQKFSVFRKHLNIYLKIFIPIRIYSLFYFTFMYLMNAINTN